MKKKFTFMGFIFVAALLLASPAAFAQSASSTIINARILPTIWYSTLYVNDGDTVNIYAAIQNNSGSSFTGTAAFYVDEQLLAKKSFNSAADTLGSISAGWVGTPGSHSVQVILSPILTTGKSLVAYSSEKSNISIIRNITPAAVQQAALTAANNVVAKTDVLANSLADKIESMKVPIVGAANGTSSLVAANSAVSKSPKKGAILGTSTQQVSDKSNSITGSASPELIGNSPMDYIYNAAMDLLAFLTRNWKWTLSGTVFIFLAFKAKSWMRRD